MELSDLANRLYSVSVRFPVKGTIKEGDILFLSFHMRGLYSEDESGMAGVQSQMKVNPKSTKSDPNNLEVNKFFSAGQEWKFIYFPFIAKDDSRDEGTEINFFFGLRPEIFEIADLRLVNFGKSITFQQLPTMKMYYKGVEEGAKWRIGRIGNVFRRNCRISLKMTLRSCTMPQLSILLNMYSGGKAGWQNGMF